MSRRVVAVASRALCLLALTVVLEPDRRRFTLAQYFNPDQLQLMFPPPESLELVMQGHPRVAGNDPVVLDESRGVILLRAGGGRTSCAFRYGDVVSNRPPPDLTCVGFVNERGRGDVKRCRYTLGDRNIMLACSEGMQALVVVPVERGHRTLATFVREVAAEVISDDYLERILPWQLGYEDGIHFGAHDLDFIYPSIEYPHCLDWRVHIRWWTRGDEVGFLLVVPQPCFDPAPRFPKPYLTRKWFYPDPWPEDELMAPAD